MNAIITDNTYNMNNNTSNAAQSAQPDPSLESYKQDAPGLVPYDEPQNNKTGVYIHKFKKPFTYEGITYDTLTFNFERLTGYDMVAVENEMISRNEFSVSPETSSNYQSKLAARAAKIGSDVLDAMPLADFHKITNEMRAFLLSSGY